MFSSLLSTGEPQQIDVKSNSTYEWEVSKLAPCGEGQQHYDFTTNTHTCFAELESAHSNFTSCQPQHSKDGRASRRMVGYLSVSVSVSV